eukprot:XP_001695047.1 predicted protein [Chlamydomonas reinhardtii]
MAECSPFGLGVSGVLPGLAHPGGARAGDVSTLLHLPSTRAAAAARMPPPRQHSGEATPGSKAAGGPPGAPGKTLQGADAFGFASVFLPPHPSNALRNGSFDSPKHGDKPAGPAAAGAGGPQATMQLRPPPPAVAAAPAASCGLAQAAANGDASVAAGAAHSMGHLLRGAPTAGAGGSQAFGDASGAIGCGAMRGPASSGALPTGPGSVSAATAMDALPSVCPPSAVPASTGAATAAAAPANRPTALGPGDPLRLLHQQPPACLGRVQGELTLLYQWYVANKTVYLDQARQQLQRQQQQPTGGYTAAGVPPSPWAAMAPGPEAALAVAAALVGASGLGGRAKDGKARSAGAAEAARLPQLPLLVPPGGLGSPQQPSPRGLPLKLNHTCAAAADALAPATLAALGTEMAALSGPPAAAASAPLLATLPNTGLPAAAHPGGRAKA